MNLKTIPLALLTLLAAHIPLSASSDSDLTFLSCNIRDLDYTDTLNNLGNVYYRQGKYDLALQTYEQCQDIREKGLGEQHPHYASTCYNIALAYHRQGHYDQALQNYQYARTLYEKKQATYAANYPKILNNIALIYTKQRKYNLALNTYQLCCKLYEKKAIKYHPAYASVRHNMAILYQKQGHYDTALQNYETSRKIYQRYLFTHRTHYETTLSNIHTCQMAKTQNDLVRLKKDISALNTYNNDNNPARHVPQQVQARISQAEQNHDTATSLLALYLVAQQVSK